MPELPEVETVVRDLRPLLVGQRIRAITPGAGKLRRPWQPAWEAGLIGQRFEALHRRGKWILAHVGDSALLIHLGMTGQLTVQGPDVELANHVHLRFLLGAGELRFRDIRRFGSIEWYATPGEVHALLDTKLGPEPFATQPAPFATAIRSSARPLKAILLDQAVVAGVGNIYADEALFRARLHPRTLGKDVSEPKCELLRMAIIAVITKAIESRGSTIRDYVGGSGLRGGFQHEFCVYGRTGEPCVVCGTSISREVVAGRSSHTCPQCQNK